MKFQLLTFATAMLLAFGSGCASRSGTSPHARNTRFDFALIGDVPYNDYAATNEFPNLIEDLNRARLAFIVHDGDIKAGATPCTDELFARIYDQFQTFRHPLIYLFGDNEWGDCDWYTVGYHFCDWCGQLQHGL